MDGDGDPEDLRMRVDRLWFRHNTVRGRIMLEMALYDFAAHNNKLYPKAGDAAFHVRYQKPYAPYRRCATGKILNNTLFGGARLLSMDAGGTLSGIEAQGNENA
jgi:hypothetical protein